MRALHVAIVVSLLTEALYCAFQVLVVLDVPETNGPLLFSAQVVPMEVLVARRLYAIEGWLAFVGLSMYLAVTEMVPRRIHLVVPEPERRPEPRVAERAAVVPSNPPKPEA